MNVSWNGALVHQDTITDDPFRTATDMLWSYVSFIATAHRTSTTLTFTSTTDAKPGNSSF